MPAALHELQTSVAPQSHGPQTSNQMYVPPASSTAHTAGSMRGGGPISDLQEFVQRDRRFPVCSHRPILKWEWDTRMANAVTLEFRATVSFIFEGIPHHASGAWQTSKKTAQRDAAERVLIMLKEQPLACNGSQGLSGQSSSSPAASALDKFSAFCAQLTGSQKGEALQWSWAQKEGGWQATVEVCIYGDVVHTLQGALCSDRQSAMEDTANRALWYLKAPNHVNAFKVSHDEVVQETLDLPSNETWLREGMVADADLYRSTTQQRAAEQKTTLMREQNRLQKKYGKDLPAGTPVWDWSYEYSPMTDQNPVAIPVCRAKVWIAGPNIEFQGDWCRGQKQAQLNACAHVTEFLDAEERSHTRR